MKWFLISLFAGIFLCMTCITVAATLDKSLLQASRELWPDLWFRATLMDAYFGFVTFFVWLAYKEKSWFARGVWFVLIMSLGNFAMSGYMLWQLSRTREFSWEGLLLRREPTV